MLGRIALVTALLLGGCTAKVEGPFIAADHEACAGPGSARIDGQAFALTRGGDVKTAAGRAVYLVPDTAYTREMATKMLTGLQVIATPELDRYARETVADAGGNFSFTDLPACAFLIITTVVWQVPPYGSTTGGTMWSAVRVADGQTARVIVRR